MLTAGLRGLESLEAGFEFGAYLALNLGIASGGVSASVGFYYHMKKVEKGQESQLSGYIRLQGYLNVLDLISINAVFCLSLKL